MPALNGKVRELSKEIVSQVAQIADSAACMEPLLTLEPKRFDEYTALLKGLGLQAGAGTPAKQRTQRRVSPGAKPGLEKAAKKSKGKSRQKTGSKSKDGGGPRSPEVTSSEPSSKGASAQGSSETQSSEMDLVVKFTAPRLGMSFKMISNQVQVTNVAGEAKKKGVQAGDYIVKIGNTSMLGAPIKEVGKTLKAAGRPVKVTFRRRM